MKILLAFLESLRPRQWTKNLLLFAGLLFSQSIFEMDLFLKAVAGFMLFCVLSGSEYIINDLIDIDADREHPVKSKRPLASGRLPIPLALIGVFILIFGGLAAAFMLNVNFGWVALVYVILMLGYTLAFKRVVILDVIIIALGFVLRAVAGALVIDVTISSWLLVCTTFLALFLGLSKRRHELVLLGDDAANHRKILGEYSPYLLDQMIGVVTASTVMAYALYTTAAETVEKFGTRNLIFTLPFVLYGIFRYLYLVHQKQMGGSPEMILLKDRAMIINILLYIITAGYILYRQ
jgi:4-hydroxybenzoate polyprenyltransferase